MWIQFPTLILWLTAYLQSVNHFLLSVCSKSKQPNHRKRTDPIHITLPEEPNAELHQLSSYGTSIQFNSTILHPQYYIGVKMEVPSFVVERTNYLNTHRAKAVAKKV